MPSYASSFPGELRLKSTAADVLDCLEQAVIVADRRGRIQYRNARAAAWLPDGDDLASALARLRVLEPFGGWSTVLARVVEGGEACRFKCALPPPGRASPALAVLRCTPLRDRRWGRITGAVVLVDEDPPQEMVDARIEVSRRLASLGKLATCVAHELNNPLDGILRYINLALRAADETPHSKLKSYLSESRTGLMRMLQIIGELLEFSRTSYGEFEEMSVNEVVEEAIKSTSAAAAAGRVVVAADFQHGDMPAACGSRLYQVCCNLIKNAVDAMPDGGRLAITTGVVDDCVVIRVADTGVGLPEPVEKVFEPFFTTKEAGKGTGLGLAICKDFIEDMQGTITAAQGEEGGAVFCVRIPLSSFQRPSRLAARGTSASPADVEKG